jgi:hypothetical protein
VGSAHHVSRADNVAGRTRTTPNVFDSLLNASVTSNKELIMIRKGLSGVTLGLLVVSLASAAQAQQQGPDGGVLGREPTLFLLVRNKAIQKEIGLDDASKVLAIANEFTDAMRTVRESADLGSEQLRDLPPAERSAKMREQLANCAEVKEKVTEMLEPKLKEALTAEQFARIKEIKVQAAGVAALAHADVAKGLGLSDEQQKKIADIRAEGNKSISDLNPFRQGAQRNGNIQETPAKVREIHAATLPKATDVLDAGQKEKFAAMKGKPFDVAQLTAGGRGGQRGRRGNN